MSRAILIVDHGSRRQEANQLLEDLAERVRARAKDFFVQVAHLDISSPSIAEGIDACVAEGVDEIVVHPFFLGAGRHSADDIPRLVREATGRHPGLRVRVTPPLGPHEKLVDIVLERVEQTRGPDDSQERDRRKPD